MADKVQLSEMLADLDARHDDVLVRLDELNRQIEQTISEWVPAKFVPKATLPSVAPAPLPKAA